MSMPLTVPLAITVVVVMLMVSGIMMSVRVVRVVRVVVLG